MQPTRIRALRGPNVFTSLPALRAEIAPHGEDPVDADAAGRLLSALPGLAAHPDTRSGRDAAGDARFADRLRAGVPAALVVEHVARELLHLAGADVPFEAPRLAVPPAHVVVPFTDEAAARQALTEAVALVAAAAAGDATDTDAAVACVRRRMRRSALGPSTRALVEAAERRGIPWERLDGDSLVRLGHGRHARLLRAAVTSATSALAADAAQSKEMTKCMLQEALVPVPYGIVAADEDEAVEALSDLRTPVVLKPLRGNHGRGVTVGVETPEQAREAYALARTHGRFVVVEERLCGHDYRVLVVGGRVVAAAERCPCHVVGDGRRTVAELIEAANADPRRGKGHEAPLTRIDAGDAAEACLARQGLTLASVPADGATVRLSDAANLSTGGTARDVTDELHPDVRVACERAARAVGLDVCGVDLITADIGRPLARREGIVEVNASPGLRMHLYPTEGKPRDVAGAIIDHLFPDGTPARVPIVAVTGTNGKTTTARLVRHVLCAASRLQVGMTTTSGVWVGDTRIVTGDTTGPASARAVLADPTVDVAVLETARGGIVRRGLGYDLADVAVVTNVREDHLGQDGIETLDDVIAVKSIVAERVRDGGTLVVNADDEGAMRLLDRLDAGGRSRRLALVTMEPDRPLLRRHLTEGGTAYTVRDGCIVETTWSGEVEIVRVDHVPITLGGMADFQVANVLGVVAACRALGVPPGALADALRTFDAAGNEGRLNVYRLGQGHVVVDYGHTPDAFEAVGRLLCRWRPGVPSIGVVSAPGDRSDDLIRSAGAAAVGAFSTLVLCDDRDRRGRAIGETVALLREGATRARPDVPIEVEADEASALRAVLDRVREGHVAVVFYEVLSSLVEVLDAAGAVPLAGTVAASDEPVRTFQAPPGGLSGDGVGPVHAPLPALVPRSVV